MSEDAHSTPGRLPIVKRQEINTALLHAADKIQQARNWMYRSDVDAEQVALMCLFTAQLKLTASMQSICDRLTGLDRIE